MARWLEVKIPAGQPCHPSSVPESHVNITGENRLNWGYLLMSTCVPWRMCHLTASHTLVKLKFDVKLLKSSWDQYSNVSLVCHISNNTFRNSHDGVYPPGEHKGRGLCTWGQPGQYSRSQTRAVQRLKHVVMCLHPGAALYVPNPSPQTSVQGRGYLKKMNSLHKLLTEW